MANEFQFSTKQADKRGQLVDFGFRWYDAEIGRWTQRDPLGMAAGLNLYGYCNGNPVNLIDPWGLQAGGEPNRDTPNCGKHLPGSWVLVRREGGSFVGTMISLFTGGCPFSHCGVVAPDGVSYIHLTSGGIHISPIPPDAVVGQPPGYGPGVMKGWADYAEYLHKRQEFGYDYAALVAAMFGDGFASVVDGFTPKRMVCSQFTNYVSGGAISGDPYVSPADLARQLGVGWPPAPSAQFGFNLEPPTGDEGWAIMWGLLIIF